MKHGFTIIILLLIFPNLVLAQEKIEFDLVFGSYMNDHDAREFYTQERHWIFKDDELIYSIDAHDKRYVDTISLSNGDIQLIKKRIQEHKPTQSIIKDVSVDYLNKEEWTVSIKGSIGFENEIFTISIEANGPSILDADSDVKILNELEGLLYSIIENY